MTYDYIKQKKILLVDDKESLCQMVYSIFQKEHYTRLRTAGTMAEALTICKEWKPDFAVLDVMLPDGDGISLLEKIFPVGGGHESGFRETSDTGEGIKTKRKCQGELDFRCFP